MNFLFFLLFLMVLESNTGLANRTLQVQEALNIHNSAVTHINTLAFGGECDLNERKVPRTSVEYYYCEELNSPEKISKYLEEVFTNNETSQIMKDLKIKYYDGKPSFIPSDSGSMNDWTKANGTIIKQSKNQITYEFIVPLRIESTIPPAVVQIDYVYESGKGWRMNNIPSSNFR